MLAVIFKAKVNQVDNEYLQLVERLRKTAKEFGCIDIDSVCENGSEITISYWHSIEQITNWKNNPEHKIAQNLGKEKYYKSYSVQVVDILREYSHGV